MNTAKRGNEATFVLAVKEHLFWKIKFLQGKNLEYNLEATSICGYLRLHCNVAEKDAPMWWDDLQGKLKKTHTDCRNNKIKTIKQQYYGKLITMCQNITHRDNYSLCPSSSKAWFRNQDDKDMARKSLQNALQYKRRKEKDYLKFIIHFGPAFTGIRTWNENKICKQASELLTVMDEAFIHLCLYNYSETWKAQEKRKEQENSNIQVPVSTNAAWTMTQYNYQQSKLTLNIIYVDT